MPTRPEEALANMIAGLKDKTGKTIEEWTSVIRDAAHQKHGEIVKFLKEEHGLTHGFANQIALHFGRQGKEESGDPIAEMYSGAKAGLRPMYDLLMAKIQAFGPDVDTAPKKGYVSVRRSKQFAVIQPSTATRLDVGINLKGVEPHGRLEASGSFNAMLSHRVKLASVSDVDDELVGWLKQAYDAA